MLTPLQVSEFEQQGLLRLPQMLPAATALSMRDRLWAFLSRVHGRRHNDPSTWRPLDGRTRFKTLMRTGAFHELAGHLAEPITDLLGAGAWNPPATVRPVRRHRAHEPTRPARDRTERARHAADDAFRFHRRNSDRYRTHRRHTRSRTQARRSALTFSGRRGL
jgi:hypothetical protein